MKLHPLHEAIGRLIKSADFSKYGTPNVLMDTACDLKNRRRISFCRQGAGTYIRYCDVDMLITIERRAKVIIEIEESNVKPIHIFGKFFTSSFSDSFIYTGKDNRKPLSINNSVLFVQVLDSSKLNYRNSMKPSQWTYIEQMIQDGLKNPFGRITEYNLFQGKSSDFEPDAEEGKRLVKKIRDFLDENP